MAETTTTKPAPKGKAAVKEIAKRVGKAKHPLVGSKDTNVYPFKALPADYNADTMQGLRRKDFADVATFLEYRASMLERAAIKMRARAKEERELGGEDKKDARKLARAAQKMAELAAVLAAKGMNTDDIIARAKKMVEEQAAAAAATAAAAKPA